MSEPVIPDALLPAVKITSVDQAGENFLITLEALRLKPYPDSKGIPTISVGCTYYEDGTRVKFTDPPITHERAMSLFRTVRKEYEKSVAKAVKSRVNQNQFTALIAIAYNIGIPEFKGSTLLKLVNKDPNHPGIDDAFRMFRFSGGKPILLKRRNREIKYYHS